MKKNITLICLEKNYSRNIGKLLADNLEMFFVNINDILEYNLVNNDMLESAGKTYFDKEKKKVISGFADYENAIFCGNFELFSEKNVMDSFKNNSIVIYLNLKKETIEKLQSNDDMQHLLLAFDTEDRFCQMCADIVVNVNLDLDNSIKEINKSLKSYFIKTENE